jgi:putative two-component system response regulator
MITHEQILNAPILVVDDQKLHLHYLEKVLHEEGYKNITCVSEPLKVLATVQSIKPDLVVLDLIMPQLDGFQIIEQLNEFRREHYLPILALSSEKGPDIRMRALQSGATDFLYKPFEDIEIMVRIRNMIEMRILTSVVENQNKILEIKVQERTKELRETQLDIIRRLAQAAEFRDNTTGAHIMRMSHYSMEFGKALGMNAYDCDLLLHASPLHDVGKIGIPDSILLKKGPLTPEEFEIMKGHATIGAQLLRGSDSPIMKMAQVIALTHQEKWDGTGYPRQLKGDEIPLVGQLCAVCDVFDAMTSPRPYKKAWSTQDAVGEMVKEKGTHFQPRLIDRFVEILPAIEAIKKQYTD